MARPERPTALITGGNRGIGLAMAKDLVRDHRVVIGVRDLGAGQAIAKEIGAEAVHLDLEQPDGFDAALAEIGGVDVLINNAGILIETNMLRDPEGFHRSMQVMCLGVFDLIRASVPHMAAQNWGRIVNLSSGWGAFSQGMGGPGAYGLAKAALNALTFALPRDLPKGVTINAVCPGWVRTDMGGPAASLSPEEGADTALWLARQDGDGPTGGFFRRRVQIDW